MATLHDALGAVTAGIAAGLASGIDVDQHPGRFTEAELERLLLRKRAVRVAIEAIPSATVLGPGTLQAELLFSALICCGDTVAKPRHVAALDLVEDLLRLIPHQRWGLAELRAALPSTLSVDNLYTGEINRKGMALWAVGWRQGYQNRTP